MKLLEHFKELSLYPKNAEELKGLILQLAVQGKLTVNWRKENPGIKGASELFDQVRTHNLELLQSKKRRVKKKSLEYNLILDLPDTWVQVKNQDLFTLQKGKNPKDLSERVMKYSYQDIEALDRGNIRRYSNDEKAPKCTDEDILVVCDGSRSGLVLNGRAGIVGSTLAVIETPKFIQDYLKILFLQDFKRANTNMKGAAIPHLDTNVLLATDVGFPPLEEQKVIVEVVNTFFKEVEQLESLTKERIQLKESFVVSALTRLKEAENTQQGWNFLQQHFSSFFTEKKNIKSLRETVLQLAIQGKLTEVWRANNPNTEPASELLKRIEAEKQKLISDKKIKKEKSLPSIEEDETPYELPEGWVWCRMQEIGLFERGKSKHRPRNDNRLFDEGQYPLVQTGDVSASKNTGGIITTNKSYYNDFGLQQSRMWNKGTLCITIAANIAETGFLGFNACFPDSVVGFTDLSGMNESLSKYVDCYITVTKSDLEKYAPSTAQKNINLGILYELNFPLAPREEQKAIVEKVNSLMALCDELEQQIETSQTQIEQLMQSCLKEVFEHESN